MSSDLKHEWWALLTTRMLLQDLQTPGHLIQELPPPSAGRAVHKPFAVSPTSLLL